MSSSKSLDDIIKEKRAFEKQKKQKLLAKKAGEASGKSTAAKKAGVVKQQNGAKKAAVKQVGAKKTANNVSVKVQPKIAVKRAPTQQLAPRNVTIKVAPAKKKMNLPQDKSTLVVVRQQPPKQKIVTDPHKVVIRVAPAPRASPFTASNRNASTERAQRTVTAVNTSNNRREQAILNARRAKTTSSEPAAPTSLAARFAAVSR